MGSDLQIDVASTPRATSEELLEAGLTRTIYRIRERSALLRFQAFGAISVLVVAAIAIAWIFISLHQLSGPSAVDLKTRDPYDYKLMETRHEALSARLKGLAEILADAKHELITDKYGKNGANHELVVKMLQVRIEELGAVRSEIENRFSRDRQNMYTEILQLRSERDRARDDSAEKRSFLRLFGDAIMRIGVLVLALYLIAIVSNIAKYWLRVADHLNSIADSLDLLYSANLSLSPAIAALTPHAIDFQVDNLDLGKTLQDLISAARTFEKKSPA